MSTTTRENEIDALDAIEEGGGAGVALGQSWNVWSQRHGAPHLSKQFFAVAAVE